ncbi:E3 ubiquitin-protein ligase CCNB1IP1 homolog isoform X3 [Dendrobium catenatum]|nr:E3 ubiquitin-protein ligase CCNB1IP1 homolog isoform X2 [Dendrobium catenatum]XP_020691262.1 E3 ubiquitin-protein ligase CCNB1IP1 homolog isoform X3 [Dendrobium catenatum]
MRCNACWRELEGQAISTTCGHLLCTEDAGKILSNDGACPICDQVLSRSHMRPVDINPGDEWTNMAMAGISPQILMKTAYRSVMFYIGQKELEMQYKMNKMVGQCRQKCESMQEKFTEKLEQVHAAYQKMAKRCQIMEQENASLTKDTQELQEKYAEKSRQKRKLEDMYDQLRGEYESMKRSAIQPVSNFFPRTQPDLFSSMANMIDSRDPTRQGQREEIWPSVRQKNSSGAAFDLSEGSPVKMVPVPVDARASKPARPLFGAGVSNPAATLRNLIISPMKRPQLSRNRSNLFT